MLQYMRDTTLENPDIIVKDKRIVDLDRIVEEVKQSEEWEAVKMNILEIGIEQGIEQGIKALIKPSQELNVSRGDISAQLMKEFSLQEDTAEAYLRKYWQHSK